MEEAIENKVANSALLTINLEELKPHWDMVGIDIANNLYEGIVLREKEFRAYVSEHDWSQYKSKSVFIYCSVDAIIPTWAYMLMAVSLSDVASKLVFGSKADLELELWRDVIATLDLDRFAEKRIVVKGCSDEEIPTTIFVELVTKLTPIAKSLMFGEPCSTVPLYKAKK